MSPVTFLTPPSVEQISGALECAGGTSMIHEQYLPLCIHVCVCAHVYTLQGTWSQPWREEITYVLESSMGHSTPVAYMLPGPITPPMDYAGPRTRHFPNLSFATDLQGTDLKTHSTVHCTTGLSKKSLFSLWFHFFDPSSLFTSQMGRAS